MHTLCLPRSSFESAEDMILRRMEEGAEKCALRDLRREDETSVEQHQSKVHPKYIQMVQVPSIPFRHSNRTERP